MKKHGQLIVLSLLFSLLPFYALATEVAETAQAEIANATVMEGKVKRYNQETQTVLLQLKSGEKISVSVNWETALVGYSSPSEIAKGHKVKIWHLSNGEKTTALKVEKKLMVGC